MDVLADARGGVWVPSSLVRRGSVSRGFRSIRRSYFECEEGLRTYDLGSDEEGRRAEGSRNLESHEVGAGTVRGRTGNRTRERQRTGSCKTGVRKFCSRRRPVSLRCRASVERSGEALLRGEGRQRSGEALVSEQGTPVEDDPTREGERRR